MTDDVPRRKVLLARVVVVLMIVLLVAGVVWHGISLDVLERIWRNLLDRPGGQMTFRFFLQPIMATIAAVYDGLRDARSGRSPYLWTILTDSANRGGRLHEGLISTSRVILLGLVMDVIYQLLEFGTFHPGEAVIIALLLAFVPYLLLRGPIARIARWWRARAPAKDSE